MDQSVKDIFIFICCYINNVYTYCTLYMILLLPSEILKVCHNHIVYIPVNDDISDSDSDSDSETEIIKKSNNDISLKKIVLQSMEKNEIRSMQFPKEFISDYSGLFFDIHLKYYKEYKPIEFLKVEILDTHGFIIDLTYKIKYFIKEDYIHTQKLIEMYPHSEFLFLLYKDKKGNEMKKKIVYIPNKRELIVDKKCSFGKLML